MSNCPFAVGTSYKIDGFTAGSASDALGDTTGAGITAVSKKEFGLAPEASFKDAPVFSFIALCTRSLRLPPRFDFTERVFNFPSFHSIFTISKPPQARSPVMLPDFHSSGSAGNI